MARLTFIQNLLVGILFFGALSIVGYFTIISEGGPFARPGVRILVFFDSVGGVELGSRVTIHGIRGGRVVSIDPVSVDANKNPVSDDSPDVAGQRVVLTIELTRAVVFYSNYQITLRSESLVSGNIVNIDPGSLSGGRKTKTGKSADMAATAIPVETFSNADLARRRLTPLEIRIKEKRGPFVDLQGRLYGDLIAGLTGMVAENRDDVRRTVRNAGAITGKIDGGTGTIGKLVNESELYRNAKVLVNDAQVVLRQMREGKEDAREPEPVIGFFRAVFMANSAAGGK